MSERAWAHGERQRPTSRAAGAPRGHGSPPGKRSAYMDAAWVATPQASRFGSLTSRRARSYIRPLIQAASRCAAGRYGYQRNRSKSQRRALYPSHSHGFPIPSCSTVCPYCLCALSVGCKTRPTGSSRSILDGRKAGTVPEYPRNRSNADPACLASRSGDVLLQDHRLLLVRLWIHPHAPAAWMSGPRR